jgi:hypothetical protein
MIRWDSTIPTIKIHELFEGGRLAYITTLIEPDPSAQADAGVSRVNSITQSNYPVVFLKCQ